MNTKKSMHDILMMIADVEQANLHKDRLSRIVEDTLLAIDETDELLDDELENIVAARKDESLENWEPSRGRIKK